MLLSISNDVKDNRKWSLFYSDFTVKIWFFHFNYCQFGAVTIYFPSKNEEKKTCDTVHSRSSCLSANWWHSVYCRLLPYLHHLPASTLPTFHPGPNQREFTPLLLLSWVLPGSGSRAAELTHSSPGPMPPQSTTAPLRTLEYSSAARPGQPGGRRQENGSGDRSPLSFIRGKRGGWPWCEPRIWVSVQHRKRKHDPQTTSQPLFEQWPIISTAVQLEDQAASRGRSRGGECRRCWARLVSAEL